MQDLFLAVCSFFSCAGFCIIYNLRGSVIITSSLGGAIGFFVYQLCAPIGNDLLQYFIATIALSTYAEIMARIYKKPVTVFSIVAILPLVPGGGMYYTMEYLIMGDNAKFATQGLHTLLIAGTLAIGIILVSSLSRLFTRVLAHFKRVIRKI